MSSSRCPFILALFLSPPPLPSFLPSLHLNTLHPTHPSKTAPPTFAACLLPSLADSLSLSSDSTLIILPIRAITTTTATTLHYYCHQPCCPTVVPTLAYLSIVLDPLTIILFSSSFFSILHFPLPLLLFLPFFPHPFTFSPPGFPSHGSVDSSHL